MEKFEDVDIIRTLEEIMKTNTRFYSGDFVYDREELIHHAVADHRPLLWMSRKSGTYLFPEREVFCEESFANNTWCFYGRNRFADILAYAVDIKRVCVEGTRFAVKGDIYPLDYEQHWQYVQAHAVPVEGVTCAFQNGVTETYPVKEFIEHWYELTQRNGKLTEKKNVVSDEDALLGVLSALAEERKNAVSGDIREHIAERKRDCGIRYEQAAMPKIGGMQM